MQNEILKIQQKLMNEMDKLEDAEHMKLYGKKEVSISQALTQSAGAYLKAVNTQLKIKDIVNHNSEKEKELLESIGVLKNEANNK